jgi:hypothetical protein
MPNRKKADAPASGDFYQIPMLPPEDAQSDADVAIAAASNAHKQEDIPDWLDSAFSEGRVYTPGLHRADLTKPSFVKTRDGDKAITPGSYIGREPDSYFLTAYTDQEYKVQVEGVEPGTQGTSPAAETPTVEQVTADPAKMKQGQGDTRIQGSESPSTFPLDKATEKQPGVDEANEEQARRKEAIAKEPPTVETKK